MCSGGQIASAVCAVVVLALHPLPLTVLLLPRLLLTLLLEVHRLMGPVTYCDYELLLCLVTLGRSGTLLQLSYCLLRSSVTGSTLNLHVDSYCPLLACCDSGQPGPP